MASFSKFIRPKEPTTKRRLSSLDLDLVEAVLRYRFSPTSELVRLVGGNEDVARRRLRWLWERQSVNRFAFPTIPNHGEFIYYLDRIQTLDLLVQNQRLDAIDPQMAEELRLNREADYASAVANGQHMKLGFLKHSLAISRLHFMLEMACRNSQGRMQLISWRQGAQLRGAKVEVPEITSQRIDRTNYYVWREQDKHTRLPVEPDALFTLQLLDRFAAEQLVHFCYEADRGTMPLADMLKKFRGYHHFIKREQKHREAFGVHPIRAVLIETTDERRARSLMKLASDPIVIGATKRTGLFWFTITPIFVTPISGHGMPEYLTRPEIALDDIWALPDLKKKSICESENKMPKNQTP